MHLNKSMNHYLEELSSDSPTPGGGNVSALCGALAASLGQMVCALTSGKKKYETVEKEINAAREKLKIFKEDFLILAQKDNEAFDRVMDAYKLPKETEEQKMFRKTAIDNATIEAASVPSEVIIRCREIIPILKLIAEKGNQSSVSDAGVAISLTSTAAQGAFLNVAINCSSLSNQIAAAEFLKKSEIFYNEINNSAEKIINDILNKLKTRP